MPAVTISQMTEITAPDKASKIELSTPSKQTRAATLESVRKHVLGEPLTMPGGSNAAAGKATLVGGTVVVSTSKVTANTLILVTPQETGTLAGVLRISARTAGASFTVSSSDAGDTCDFAWFLIEP